MKCVICKSESFQNVGQVYKYSSEIFKKLFPDLVVKKCNSCGLVQVDIEDTEENNNKLFEYYQKDYRDKANIPSLDDKNSMLYQRGDFISSMIAKHINYNHSKLTIFEKGCGFGFNLLHMKNKIPQSVLYTDEMDEHVKSHLEKIGVQARSWMGGGGIMML